MVVLSERKLPDNSRVRVYADFDSRPPKYTLGVKRRGIFSFERRTNLTSRLEPGCGEPTSFEFYSQDGKAEVKIIYKNGRQQRINI